MSLVSLLGLPADTRAVIITCENLGTSHAANSGVFTALREGVATSGEIVMPGPWARHASAEYRGEDLGVRLTLTSEYELMPWLPLTHAPSLLGGNGGFPLRVDDAWEHADLDEVRRECRAQLERAVLWGLDPTHLSAHAGALLMRPEFFDIALELAVDFELPMQLGGAGIEHTVGFPLRALAAEEGVFAPDHVHTAPIQQTDELVDAVSAFAPGTVTAISMQPSSPSEELRALTPLATRGEIEANVLAQSGLRDRLEAQGCTLISYRHLRDAQRAARNAASGAQA